VTERAAAEEALLRAAVEWALIVARQDQSGEVVVPAPTGLRPYLRFRRLPPRAVRAVRVSIDGDAAFRMRVAEAAGPEEVGRAGWLWLTRPEGWEDELDALVEAEAHRLETAASDDVGRSAVRQLERAESAATRWEARAGELETELQRTRDELTTASIRGDQLATDLDAAMADVERLGDERARAVRELKEMEARLQRRDEELRALRQPSLAEAPPVAPPEPVVDTAEVARLTASALAGLDAIDAALSELAELVQPQVGSTSIAEAAPRRRPVRIGQGHDEDSTEAARWLLGLDAVVVLVDGYNVTMTVWPDLVAADQRRSLVSALTALSGRTGARFSVVFDGDGSQGGAGARSTGVDVRFTASDVEADDEILRLVELVPTDEPVVVVSDDRRVRDGARRRGANVLGARQLRPLLIS
jgi:hypothetical protein